MIRLNPYLSFNGQAREALQRYHDVLGGELTLTTFAEFGQDDPAIADLIMHGQLLTADGQMLMGADTPPGMDYRPGNTATVILHGEDEQTLRRYWDGLSQGATVNVALEPQMWGDVYGQLSRRCGATSTGNSPIPSESCGRSTSARRRAEALVSVRQSGKPATKSPSSSIA
ncbi:MAG: VOC family protein [Candidatus Nanopelagicales bacterium]|nr:VOC family protein [Candidatus Nanopelagicales bacterium]